MVKDHNSDLYNLDNYNAEHKCRPLRGGGGVSLYIHDSLEYLRRDDISINNATLESVFVEIEKNQICSAQNVIIGVVYRPPDTDISIFNQHLETMLQMINSEKKKIVIGILTY